MAYEDVVEHNPEYTGQSSVTLEKVLAVGRLSLTCSATLAPNQANRLTLQATIANPETGFATTDSHFYGIRRRTPESRGLKSPQTHAHQDQPPGLLRKNGVYRRDTSHLANETHYYPGTRLRKLGLIGAPVRIDELRRIFSFIQSMEPADRAPWTPPTDLWLPPIIAAPGLVNPQDQPLLARRNLSSLRPLDMDGRSMNRPTRQESASRLQTGIADLLGDIDNPLGTDTTNSQPLPLRNGYKYSVEPFARYRDMQAAAFALPNSPAGLRMVVARIGDQRLQEVNVHDYRANVGGPKNDPYYGVTRLDTILSPGQIRHFANLHYYLASPCFAADMHAAREKQPCVQLIGPKEVGRIIKLVANWK